MTDNIGALIEINHILAKHVEDLSRKLNERDMSLAKPILSTRFVNNIVIEIVNMFKYQDFTFTEKGSLIINEGVDANGERYGLTITEVNEKICTVHAFNGEYCLHFRGLDCKGRNYDVGNYARNRKVVFKEIMHTDDILHTLLKNEEAIVKTNDGCRIIKEQ